MEEKNVIEQEANNIIDKINGAQEKIKILMQVNNNTFNNIYTSVNINYDS